MHLLLTVRQRREEAEAMALSNVLRQMRTAEQRKEDLGSARERLLEKRRAGSHLVLTGAEYMEQDSQHLLVVHSLDRLAAELKTLDQKRQQQNATYTEARCQREVISELVQQRARFEREHEKRAEQRRSDDNFLGRIGRNQDSTTHSSVLAEEGRKGPGEVAVGQTTVGKIC